MEPVFLRKKLHQTSKMAHIRALLAFGLVCAVYAMGEQAVAVKGQLQCGATPASGVHVKLWDGDEGAPLDEKRADGQGNYHLTGSSSELTGLDPWLRIYHDCDDLTMPGQRKVALRIPSQYVTSGDTAERVFDVGILNLETVFPGEKRI